MSLASPWSAPTTSGASSTTLRPTPRIRSSKANGFNVLGPARTAIDIAREHGRPYGARRRRFRPGGWAYPSTRSGRSSSTSQHWPNRRLWPGRPSNSRTRGPIVGWGVTHPGRARVELGLTGIHTQFDRSRTAYVLLDSISGWAVTSSSSTAGASVPTADGGLVRSGRSTTSSPRRRPDRTGPTASISACHGSTGARSLRPAARLPQGPPGSANTWPPAEPSAPTSSQTWNGSAYVVPELPIPRRR